MKKKVLQKGKDFVNVKKEKKKCRKVTLLIHVTLQGA